MRLFATVLVVIIFMASFSHGRNLASIRRDAFTVGVSKADSAAEYDFISEITAKMKFSRFRLVAFENANAGQRLLLDGKIDAIIAKINYSPRLENNFLVSDPYAKTEIAVAALAENNEIWTLANLNEKTLTFLPKDVSSEQIQGFWQNSKPIAAQNLSDAIKFLQKGEAAAIIANKQTLEAENSTLKIFPNKLAENDIVALFAPKSKTLQEEFNKTLKKMGNEQFTMNNEKSSKSLNPENLGPDNKVKIMRLIDELKKELELLQKELK
ncbi:MAG: transporter substrate-binding domain-containing protein [Fibromonadales bacterium]|nr:transporter substrate-binding domain-containing protein [Fibromonadales bacterium]